MLLGGRAKQTMRQVLVRTTLLRTRVGDVGLETCGSLLSSSPSLQRVNGSMRGTEGLVMWPVLKPATGRRKRASTSTSARVATSKKNVAAFLPTTVLYSWSHVLQCRSYPQQRYGLLLYLRNQNT